MLTTTHAQGYREGVTAVTNDLGRSERYRRNSASSLSGAFFLPVSYGGCLGDTFGCAGLLYPRSANPLAVAPIRCLAAARGDSSDTGVRPMATFRLFPTRNPSARAAAHRAMARAALFSDSSAATRLKRYNHHMSKARTLEAAAGAGGAA